MKNISIRFKMLAGISLPSIFVLFIAGCFITTSIGNTLREINAEKLASDSYAVSNEVNEFFTSFMTTCEGAAGNYQLENMLNTTKEQQSLLDSPFYPDIKQTMDKLAANDTTNILATWVGDFDASQVTQSDNYTSGPDWDITTRPYYNVKTTKQALLTKPYVDVSTGGMIVSAAAPVFNSSTNEVMGVFGIDIRLDQLSTIMQNYKIGETGYLVLFTEDGQILYHPDNSLVQKNMSETAYSDQIKQAVASGASGNYQFQFDTTTYYGTLTPVGNTGWMVLTSLPEAEAMQTHYGTMKILVVTLSVSLLILVLSILVISGRIARPLVRLKNIAQQIAQGNLDVKMDVKSSDETGKVAEAFGETVGQLKNYMEYIHEITSVLNQIADGNLHFQLKCEYTGEFVKIKDSLNRIKDSLTETISQIANASQQLLTASYQVSSGSQALSQGATEQASSIEELAATMDEISKNVEKNAGNAQNVNLKANEVGSELTASDSKMTALVEAIAHINQISTEIGKIIKTIEDIAFQTNILALNAAVEAARAGEAGKGFAVVADEVRNLAAKSAAAAKDTTVLINETIKAVQEGTDRAQETASSLKSVIVGAQSIITEVDSISHATKEQSVSLSQINLGIEQISGVVQNNSASAEESAAASNDLTNQAQNLQRLVQRFHVESEE